MSSQRIPRFFPSSFNSVRLVLFPPPFAVHVRTIHRSIILSLTNWLTGWAVVDSSGAPLRWFAGPPSELNWLQILLCDYPKRQFVLIKTLYCCCSSGTSPSRPLLRLHSPNGGGVQIPYELRHPIESMWNNSPLEITRQMMIRIKRGGGSIVVPVSPSPKLCGSRARCILITIFSAVQGGWMACTFYGTVL